MALKIGSLFLIGLSLSSCRPAGEPAEADTVVFLVRHAEKVDDSEDPELSDAGRARAVRLAAILASTEVDRIFSTDFIRTRETARPTAERLGLEVELYREIESLAETLASGGGRVLVVGHSNTTPGLVALLGGDPGEPIADDEYDRLYIVTMGATATTVLLRLPPVPM